MDFGFSGLKFIFCIISYLFFIKYKLDKNFFYFPNNSPNFFNSFLNIKSAITVSPFKINV